MGALLALIPTKDLLYGAAIIALLAGFGYFVHHERALGAQHEVAVVQAASAKAVAAAQREIDALNAQYSANIAQIQETYHANIQAAAADSASLAQRLRSYEASHQCPNQVLGSAAPSASSGVAGTGSTGTVESALEQLIGAAEHDNAVVVSERAERDSLTGK